MQAPSSSFEKRETVASGFFFLNSAPRLTAFHDIYLLVWNSNFFFSQEDAHAGGDWEAVELL